MVPDLTYPRYLSALVLLVGIFWMHRRTLIAVSLGIRSLVFTCIVFALAEPVLRVRSREAMLVVLEDRSQSIAPNARELSANIIGQLQHAAGKTAYVRIPFASTPSRPLVQGETETLPEVSSEDPNWAGETDISQALELAAAVVSSDKTPVIALLSDGNETRGDALATAKRIGVPVLPFALPMPTTPEVRLVGLRLPSRVRQGEPFFIDVVLKSNRNAEAGLIVFGEERQVVHETKTLVIGENTFRFPYVLRSRGRQNFTATVYPSEDTISENNTVSAAVSVEEKPRVLLLESDFHAMRDFTLALRNQDIDIEMRLPENIPQTLEDLGEFDAVVLSGVPASALTPSRMELLKTYVGDWGGGLLMFGGEYSFGPGGYHKTPVEEILPVRCDSGEDREKPSLAMALVLDRSGSMGEENMELAKDAARKAVELLTPKDFVAVIAFDHDVSPIVPIRNVSSPMVISSEIGTIRAAGGTAIYPAMLEALSQLNQVSAKIKHVILLTDGHGEPGDFEGIVRRMVQSQITVSTVGIGAADNELLRNIAEWGRGRHYVCTQARTVPQVFAAETMTVSESAMRELPFFPIAVDSGGVFSGMDFDSAPPLFGYVLTREKPTSQLIFATEHGDPLLVWWRYGLGMSAAFTSDAKNRWGAEWITWPQYPNFWAQLIRHVMKKDAADENTVRITRENDRTGIVVEALDENERYVHDGEITLTVTDPNRERSEFKMEQSAPGRYETSLSTPLRGMYEFQVVSKSAQKTVAPQTLGISIDYPRELRLEDTNRTLLNRIAELTGGSVDPDPATIFSGITGNAGQRTIPLWPWLLASAALLHIPDVLLRRFDFRTILRK